MEKRLESQEEVPQGFSTKVTYRDMKTGLVVKKDPYVLRQIGLGAGGKQRLWERPAGSGNLFNKKNEPIGRWEIDPKTKRGHFVEGAEHAKYEAPLTEDQKLARELMAKEAKIQALEKELAAVQADSEKKKNSKQGS